MRLSSDQKRAVLDACHPSVRPDPQLVRVRAAWCVVWYEPGQPRRERWRGQFVRAVRAHADSPFPAVWWGGEYSAVNRRQLKLVLATTDEAADDS